MTKNAKTMSDQDLERLHFEDVVRDKLAFLSGLGFSEFESLPTLVRYRKDDVEVDVYHGRQSYEIAAGISYFGTRYEFGDIIRAVDPTVAQQYRHAQASTPEGVVAGLKELTLLMKHYGTAALRGDPLFFTELEKKKKIWVDDYWLDMLAGQLRPKAEEAFRCGDYISAADLYGRIRTRLSPAEMNKLTISEEHTGG